MLLARPFERALGAATAGAAAKSPIPFTLPREYSQNVERRGVVRILARADILISGITLFQASQASSNVVIRGLGPSLAQSGIAGVLENPEIELRDNNGALIFANSDWQDDPAQAALVTAAGLAPPDQVESAIYATLPPGNYTALEVGFNNGTGIGKIEHYLLPYSEPGTAPASS